MSAQSFEDWLKDTTDRLNKRERTIDPNNPPAAAGQTVQSCPTIPQAAPYRASCVLVRLWYVKEINDPSHVYIVTHDRGSTFDLTPVFDPVTGVEYSPTYKQNYVKIGAPKRLFQRYHLPPGNGFPLEKAYAGAYPIAP